MKYLPVASLILFGLCVSAFAATPASVQFVGSLQQDDATPLTFDIQIPSGQTAALKLGDGYAIEFSTVGSAGNADRTTVRLTDASGKQLHMQTLPDTGLASTSFSYLICDGETRFISPAPEAPPSCSRQ